MRKKRSVLHQYHLALCEYVRGTIRQSLAVETASTSQAHVSREAPTPGTAEKTPLSQIESTKGSLPVAASETTRPRTDPWARYRGLSSRDCFSLMLRERLPSTIWAYLMAEERPNLLLNDEEFVHLITAIQDKGPPLPLFPDWVAWEGLHRSHIRCVREIRRELTPGAANQFSRVSEQCSRRLEEKNLKLWEGIEAVQDWVLEIRRQLMAMERMDLVPQPDGAFPTPTTASKVNSTEDENVRAYITILERIFDERPALRDSSMNKVLKVVGGNRQHVLAALRHHEAKGGYRGRGPRFPSRKTGEHPVQS